MRNRKDRPMDESAAYKKALKRGTRYRLPRFNSGFAILVAIFAVIILVCGIVIMNGKHKPAISEDTDTEPLRTAEVSGEEASGAPDGMICVTVTPEDVARGDLILVNSDYEFVFPPTREDVSVYDNKTISYKVNDKNVTMSPDTIDAFNTLMDDFYELSGCRDVMVVSGFRTEEFQRKLYTDRVATDGVEMAAKYVALPGHSEHHTGLAMDLSVYTDNGEGYYLRDYEPCKWLVENFENYGFVLRYPEEKAGITGISYESWHYRFVGLPHSLIMKDMGYCLEEYLEYLWQTEDGLAIAYKMSEAEDGGEDNDPYSETDEPSYDTVPLEEWSSHPRKYLVYYVKAEEEGNTEIFVPEGREYLISGDNAGGFVVTVLPAEMTSKGE